MINWYRRKRKKFLLKNPWYNQYVLRGLLWFFSWLLRRVGIRAKLSLPGKKTKDLIRRYLRLLDFSYNTDAKEAYTQEYVFQRLQNYYPQGTKFVVLTMDMEYMGGDKPAKSFSDQLEKIEDLAERDDTMLPFLCVDPRRLTDTKETDRWDWDDYSKRIDTKKYKGIKLYPALGYYPFDWRLIPIYEKALEHKLPIMTHCSHGPVYSRDSWKRKIHGTHPFSDMEISKRVLKGQHIESYTVHYTDPLNYLVLVRREYLLHYLKKVKNDTGNFSKEEMDCWTAFLDRYGEDFGKIPDFSKLKICLAHWGGGEEWDRYLEDYQPDLHERVDPLKDDLTVDGKFKDVWDTYSWFSLIHEFISLDQYNFYTDISFTLHEEKYLNILRVQMEDKTRKERILFGTDYYVVSHKETEREFSIDVRGSLGNTLWNQLADANPKAYLASDFFKPTKSTQP